MTEKNGKIELKFRFYDENDQTFEMTIKLRLKKY